MRTDPWVRPAGADELQKALAQDSGVSVACDYTQPGNKRLLLSTGGGRAWKGFPAGPLCARSTRAPLVPYEGFQVATAAMRRVPQPHTSGLVSVCPARSGLGVLCR